MKMAFIIIASIITWFIFTASGCTKVEAPTREIGDEESGGKFQITLEKSIILDTEPVLLRAKGGKGIIG